jgi:internalin A
VTIIVQGQQDQVVTFPDPNLERVVREHIDKPTGPIFRSDLISLTSLGAEERNISDLTGIEYLTNLAALSLHHNQISDITPLAGLTNLTGLRLPHYNGLWKWLKIIKRRQNSG